MKVSNSFRAVPVRMNRHGSFYSIYITYHINTVSYTISYTISHSLLLKVAKIPRTPNFQKKPRKRDF
nr:MAG TPA: hypothetical protein [Caudoviricetes sp.]DAX90833.1 MAG TPA: hypothetical protein [Caudoviricetes sp.]